jgi:hypothetical protein
MLVLLCAEMSKFVYEPEDGPLLHAGNSDECPGKYDKYNPVHLKRKDQELCSYCSLKKSLEDIRAKS